MKKIILAMSVLLFAGLAFASEEEELSEGAGLAFASEEEELSEGLSEEDREWCSVAPSWAKSFCADVPLWFREAWLAWKANPRTQEPGWSPINVPPTSSSTSSATSSASTSGESSESDEKKSNEEPHRCPD